MMKATRPTTMTTRTNHPIDGSFRRSVLLLLLLVASGLVLSSCQSSPEIDLAHESMLPDFAQSAPQTVREAYQFAIAHPEDFRQHLARVLPERRRRLRLGLARRHSGR